MKVVKTCFFTILCFLFSDVIGQNLHFTKQDTLRGAITTERIWWDLKHYKLSVEVNPNDSSLMGSNSITFQVLKPYEKMQIDLQPPMNINEVRQGGKKLTFSRDGNVYYIFFEELPRKGSMQKIDIDFEGKPIVGENPPWSGGITWSKDEKGNHFIATACQGIGASTWWPCKDHMYDEPEEGMEIEVTVPKGLVAVANGRLTDVTSNKKNSKTYTWKVVNPINNYGVNINVGNYVPIKDGYDGEKGKLTCDYYVLKHHKKRAEPYFKDQVHKMLEAFEHWFGPYPFYDDGYKLVEVPYVGMEHQSSVTYGNGFEYGYGDHRISNTPWDTTFDFIIIHESGHEWFANSITYRDIADMWVHEGFTSYSENLFLDYHFGKKASSEYVMGTRSKIHNKKPIIGYYDVNNISSRDIYYKGEQVLHYIRQLVDNDEKWRQILRGINKTFYHQVVTSQQIEAFLTEKTGIDLSLFFDQYLRDTRIPILEYRINNGALSYRWANCIDDYAVPVKIFINEKEQWLHPSTAWKTKPNISEGTVIRVDPNFYVAYINLSGQ